ncbi:hypothetical protein F4560_005294 [Saccharothrix ecbatanensis]|uniref:Uncharacterized protein n=1 Tax=Saccharothrix ecbatanensis TaxID=1105145 RepID=A0A7W9M307_9PSEU|nr:hypothetical protein [Saccharothrix ecbatanensis]MBB5805526.1 hypothetical protein [Saccharothrix ecbatanensis]
MNDVHPRPLVDREVLVVRADVRKRVPLRVWLDGYDGPRPTYRVELAPDRDRFTATGPDAFEALVRLRRQLEPEGWAVVVQGARRDTWPSGMARDMGGGLKVYVLRPGGPTATDEDLVDTFADIPGGQADPAGLIGTVAEQEACRDAWFAGR